MDENGFVETCSSQGSQVGRINRPRSDDNNQNALLPCFFFFLVNQIRTLSYSSPDCDAADLDLLRIKLLCTFAYLVGIMKFRDKTHKSELNNETFPGQHARP